MEQTEAEHLQEQLTAALDSVEYFREKADELETEHDRLKQRVVELVEALQAQEMADADPEAARRKGYYDHARELRQAALIKHAGA